MAGELSHILVPTDGSEQALDAARVAGHLARGLDAKVTVVIVHAEDIVPALAWQDVMEVDEVRARLESDAREKALPDTVNALGKLSEQPECFQLWGHPGEKICQFAEESNVSLIVMGSHGRSGFKRLVLGSVSNMVVNHAPCAVTIVR
mgnify:CR=1 FL=1